MRRRIEDSFKHFLFRAIHFDPVLEPVLIQIRKIKSIVNRQDIVRIMGTNRLIGRLCFQGTGFQRSVCKHQTVTAEITIVGQLSLKIAAVFLDAINCYHMVCPLPDTAADELRILVKQLVIVPDIAGAVAHGMRVFTQEHRHGDIIAGGKTLHLFQR